MKRLNAYLRFDGNCRQAMEFYRECLGGNLNLMTLGESPMAAQMPDKKDWVIHSTLEADSMILMASDMLGPQGITKGNAVTLCINGTDKEKIEEYFSRLSAGATISQPLEKMFFGMFGDLTDKFGVEWMFEVDLPRT